MARGAAVTRAVAAFMEFLASTTECFVLKCARRTGTNLYRARLMILSLSCQAQWIKAPLPNKRTSLFAFRSTQRFQTPSRHSWTHNLGPSSPLRFDWRCKSFLPFVAVSAAMPEASTDLLFAAAMPKEEIGALDFLKVFSARNC